MSSLYCPLELACEKAPSSIAIETKDFAVSYETLWQKKQSFASFLSKDRETIYSLALPSVSWEAVAFILAAFSTGKSLFIPNIQELPFFIELLEKKLCAKRISCFPSSPAKKSTFKGSEGNLYLMTSGSTKEPKVVILPFSALFYNALSCVEKLQLATKDRYFLSLPLYHVSGLSILFRTFLQQATLILLQDKKELYSEKQITHVSMVPTQLYRLLQSPKEQLASYKKTLKALLIGGAFCSFSLYQKAKEENLPIYLSYGLTEMASQVFMTRDPVWKKNRPYLGFPTKGQEACVQKQELLLRGNTAFLGYFKAPCPFTQEGWFPTKDLVEFDPLHGYALLGRKDRMFISLGENIYPEEIERLLLEVPGVTKARVIPQKEEEKGTFSIAYIAYEKPLESFAFLAYLQGHLAPYKVPKRILKWASNSSLKTKLDF